MHRLPAHLVVLGKNYPIKVVDDASCDDSGWLEGNTIHINMAQINDQDIDNDIMYTLLHEVGHTIFRRAGLFQAISTELEEVIVDCFAKVMVENMVIKCRKSAVTID